MMDPFYTDQRLTILAGDCRDVMAQMPAESVQMVCTSPPYLGLRDYGIAPSVWGGEAHEHEWGAAIVANATGYEVGEKARWNHRQNGRDSDGGVSACRQSPCLCAKTPRHNGS